MKRRSAQFGRVPFAVVDAGIIRRMKPADAKVYLALAAHADAGLKARPGVRRLAEVTGLLVGSVSAAVHRLEAIGALTRDWSGNGHQATYRLAATVQHTPNGKRSAPAERSTAEPFSADRTPTVQRRRANRSAPTAKPFSARRTKQIEQTEQRGAARADGLCGDDDTGQAGSNGKPRRRRSPVWMRFPTTGKPWPMSVRLRDELRDQFHNIHVDDALAGLREWLELKPEGRRAPGAMATWIRKRLGIKASEAAQRGQNAPARYADGHIHRELPTDPTSAELDAAMAD